MFPRVRDTQCASLRFEILDPGRRVVGGALAQLGVGERTEQTQQIGDTLGVACASLWGQALQFVLGLGDDVGVEQFAQLDPAEEFGEQRRVERQCRRPTFGERAVALVQELAT